MNFKITMSVTFSIFEFFTNSKLLLLFRIFFFFNNVLVYLDIGSSSQCLLLPSVKILPLDQLVSLILRSFAQSGLIVLKLECFSVIWMSIFYFTRGGLEDCFRLAMMTFRNLIFKCHSNLMPISSCSSLTTSSHYLMVPRQWSLSSTFLLSSRSRPTSSSSTLSMLCFCLVSSVWSCAYSLNSLRLIIFESLVVEKGRGSRDHQFHPYLMLVLWCRIVHPLCLFSLAFLSLLAEGLMNGSHKLHFAENPWFALSLASGHSGSGRIRFHPHYSAQWWH